MAKYKYAIKDLEENCAKCVGNNLAISLKQSIEVSKYIRGRKTTDVKRILQEAIDLKVAIPFTRFTEGAGHKAGMGSGKFAPTTCSAILKLVESAEANAQFKGFNTSHLVLTHICAQKGPARWRYGRKRRQQMKSTHVEVVVQEAQIPKEEKKEVAKPKKQATPASKKEKPKATEKKTEAKPKVEAKKEDKPKATTKKTEAKPKVETKKDSTPKADKPKAQDKKSKGKDQK